MSHIQKKFEVDGTRITKQERKSTKKLGHGVQEMQRSEAVGKYEDGRMNSD